jgi:hypothetical protein
MPVKSNKSSIRVGPAAAVAVHSFWALRAITLAANILTNQRPFMSHHGAFEIHVRGK